MAELGDASERAHEDLVELVTNSDVDLWTVGQWFGKIHASQPKANWRHFERCDDVVRHLEQTLLRGRQILIKGSRSIGLERLMPNL